MLNLSELTEADKGRRVIYGQRNRWVMPEQGVISSWNRQYVFVRYARPQGDMSLEPPGGWCQTAAATRPEDLSFAEEKDAEEPKRESIGPAVTKYLQEHPEDTAAQSGLITPGMIRNLDDDDDDDDSDGEDDTSDYEPAEDEPDGAAEAAGDDGGAGAP